MKAYRAVRDRRGSFSVDVVAGAQTTSTARSARTTFPASSRRRRLTHHGSLAVMSAIGGRRLRRQAQGAKVTARSTMFAKRCETRKLAAQAATRSVQARAITEVTADAADANSALYDEFKKLLVDYEFSYKVGDRVSGKVFHCDAKGAWVDIGAKAARALPPAEASLADVRNVSDRIRRSRQTARAIPPSNAYRPARARGRARLAREKTRRVHRLGATPEYYLAVARVEVVKRCRRFPPPSVRTHPLPDRSPLRQRVGPPPSSRLARSTSSRSSATTTATAPSPSPSVRFRCVSIDTSDDDTLDVRRRTSRWPHELLPRPRQARTRARRRRVTSAASPPLAPPPSARGRTLTSPLGKPPFPPNIRAARGELPGELPRAAGGCDEAVNSMVLSVNRGRPARRGGAPPRQSSPLAHRACACPTARISSGRPRRVKFLEVDEEKNRRTAANARARDGHGLRRAAPASATCARVSFRRSRPTAPSSMSAASPASSTSLRFPTTAPSRGERARPRRRAQGAPSSARTAEHAVQTLLSTKKLEPSAGDMLRNPALVFEKAEDGLAPCARPRRGGGGRRRRRRRRGPTRRWRLPRTESRARRNEEPA